MSSESGGESQNSSLLEQGEEHILSQNKVDEYMQTARSTSKDQIPSQSSTDEVETPTKKMDDGRTPSDIKNGKDRKQPRNNVNEQNPSP